MALPPLLGINLLARKGEIPTGFDLVFSPLKRPNGNLSPPLEGTIGTFSFFGDTLTAIKNPGLRAISKKGLPALPGEKNLEDGFAWGWICPNDISYREKLKKLLKGYEKAGLSGILIEDLQYPDINYCHCSRCKELFEKSHGRSEGDWFRWRSKTIIEFLREVKDLTVVPLSVSLSPDPLGLYTRFGVDLPSIERNVEFFVIPLYDLTYKVTYLLEAITYDFLQITKIPIFIELYAAEPEPKDLLRAILAIIKFSIKGVILYDPSFTKIPLLKKEILENKEITKKLNRIKNQRFNQIIEKIKALPL